MKRILIGCILFVSIVAQSFAQSVATASPDSVSVDARDVADAIIEEAKRYLGRPYQWAGNGPDRFDCTGFTKYVYAKFGYKLGRTVAGQVEDGRLVEGGLDALQKGDILIFGARFNKKALGHAAIFIEMDPKGDNFTFIHAARRGVIISELKETYYTERFLGAVRILPDFSPIQEDTTAFDRLIPENTVLPPDTLRLAVGDKRIVLFENGTWVEVYDDGSMHLPSGKDPVYLFADGHWRAAPPASTVTIPTIQKEEPASGTSVRSSASRSSTQTSTEKQYHTIRSGDTLSKIAARYHTSVRALCNLNGINQNTVLKIGKKIRVK